LGPGGVMKDLDRTPDLAETWPASGEALVFLTPAEVRALVRGVVACVEAANLPVHDPGAYGHADIVLRGTLKVARHRLEDAGVLPKGFYLDPRSWPEESDVPAFLGREEGRALYRGAVACRAVGTWKRPGPRRTRFDEARRVLLGVLQRADAQLGREATP